MSSKRIFFALWPTQKQRQLIESAIEPHRKDLSGKWMVRDNLHVTLVFIGNFPEKDIVSLQEAAGIIQCPHIKLSFEWIDFWKRQKIMCLHAPTVPDDLVDLVKSLESEASAFGYEPEKRPYKPHMTIARKAGFFQPILLAQPLVLRWAVFELIESISTPKGVRYRPLKQ